MDQSADEADWASNSSAASAAGRRGALIEGARFSEALAALGPAGIMPKGVYRFRSHEQANQHQAEWLAHGMADLALRRLR